MNRFIYTPYGQRAVLTATWTAGTTDFMLGHQGLTLDGESGLYSNRARYLHPTLGTFTTRDPLGYVDGGNVYQLGGGNPASRIDPTGRWNVWDGLRYLPVFGTIYDWSVTSRGTSPGDYDGWGQGGIAAFNCACQKGLKLAGENDAEATCRKEIDTQALKYVCNLFGIPVATDVGGDLTGLLAELAAKRAGVAGGAAATGVGVVLGVDAVANLGALMDTAYQIKDAATKASNLQCRCQEKYRR